MKCPIRMIAAATTQTPYDPRLNECLKEECAWWDEPFEHCAIRGLLDTLRTTNSQLLLIQNKMPTEEQFTK